MKEPSLISDSAILMIPTSLMSSVMRSLTSSPLRDLTDSTSPSTASMVPRTRDGVGGCWAITRDGAAITTSAASDKAKRWNLMDVLRRQQHGVFERSRSGSREENASIKH